MSMNATEQRVNFMFTDKHGSCLLQAGLNIAEIELSVLSSQCLQDRTPDLLTLKKQTEAWMRNRNQKNKVVNWRFTTAEARIKLKKLYPDYSEF